MPQGLLVLNAGSSSIKFALFEAPSSGAEEPHPLVRGQIAGIGAEPTFEVRGASGESLAGEEAPQGVADHGAALAHVLRWIGEHSGDRPLAAVGHRVVHGGSEHVAPALVDEGLIAALDRLSPLAPHHQPHNVAAIRAVAEQAPELPQVACFDTAFHASQPPVARRLPLPEALAGEGLQRYGFHGLSYEYVVDRLRRESGDRGLPQRLVVAHLGNGASMCAVRAGRCIATTMGFSTLDGLVMGTRCGSLDPGVLLYLMREHGMGERALTDLLYNRSGLLGLSGLSSDMRTLLESDDARARAAVESFCYSVVRHLGSLAAALEGLDALVFTGGIGENAAAVRARVCRQLGWLGVRLDAEANRASRLRISTTESPVSVWVVPTNEELVIARHTSRLLRMRQGPGPGS